MKQITSPVVRISILFVIWIVALLALGSVLPAAQPVQAATCSVTSNADSGAGSLRALLADASCDTITFAGDATIRLASPLSPSRGVTVDGGTHRVILSGDTTGDGTGDTRLFSIPSGLTVTLNNLTLEKGRAVQAQGGAIENFGTLTVANSTLSGNSSNWGGAIYSSAGALTVTNSTFVTNSAAVDGGAVYNSSGLLTVTNSTFVGNSASAHAGAIYNSGATPAVYNSILLKGSWGANCSITASTAANNLADDASCGTGFTQVEPGAALLGSLGDYGGGTQTVPLLPGSPAIDGGSSTYCPATDPRGIARPQGAGCDIGAFESQGFILAVSGGDNQTADLFAPFTAPLEVTVSSAHGEPVDGGAVVFAAPASGATAQLSAGSATLSGGKASIFAMANSIPGSYNVTASARGANSVSFSLTNQAPCPLIVTSNADDGPGTLRALLAATGCDTITFASDTTIRLASQLSLSRSVTVDGGTHQVILSGDSNGDGTGDTRLFWVPSGVTVALNNLTLEKGHATRDGGGAIYSQGDLTVSNCVFSDNSIGYGWTGGAIYAEYSGQLTVIGSTFTGNSSQGGGGAIMVYDLPALTVSNSTFFDNHADSAGGALSVWVRWAEPGTALVANSTFAGNTAASYASAIDVYGTVLHLANTLVSGSSALANCIGYSGGAIIDDGGNLSYPDASCPGIHADPLLGPLQNNGGPTRTMALGAGSPAIDTGVSAACQNAKINNHDQRGYARFVDGNGDGVAQCDVGAFEYGAVGPPTAVLDREPPEISIVLTPAEPDGANGWYLNPVTVKPQATDASPVIDLRCALDPADPPASFDDLPAELCPFLGGAEVSAEGRHTFYAAAADIWGNKSAPVSASFKIDTPPLGLTSLEMTVNRDQAYAGAILEYKLVVRNLTPAEQAFAVTDPIPASTEIVRRISYNPATNSVEWSGVVEPWGFKTFTVYVRVASGTPGGTAIVNTAAIEDEAATGSASATTIVKTLPPYRGHRADVDVNEIVIRGR